MIRRLAVRLQALLRRRIAESELDEELQYHLDRDIARNVAAGLSPTEARLAAARAFGNVPYLKEEVRDTWRIRWRDALIQDVRCALRGFRRAPAFVATVVVTIALALGLNTTVFTIFNAYVLRPLAVRDAGSLVQLFVQDRRGRSSRLSWQQYQELRALPIVTESFAHTIAFARSDQRPMFGSLVTGDALLVLGARPALGRLLVPEDAAPPAGEAVVVLSYTAWRAMFGGDSTIVGRTILLRGMPFIVVGIAAESFTGFGAVPPDFWAPVTQLGRLTGADDLFGATQPSVLRAVLRLKTGVNKETARSALANWAATATASLPDSLQWTHVDLQSVGSALPLTAETIGLFTPAAVAFGLVLLIACANVANVMLARGVARQREIGIRLALGAGQARLVQQLLTESALLAIAAAAIGFFISRLMIDAAVHVMFVSAPSEFAAYLRVAPLAPDVRVFGFVLLVGLGSALMFGLVPALQATRLNLVQTSRGDFDAGFRVGHARGALVIAQVGACSLLLIVTGVLLGGARATGRIDVGMRTHDVVELVLGKGAAALAVRRLRKESFVSDIGVSTQTPLDGIYPAVAVHAAGDRRVEVAAYDFVDAGFFRVLGIAISRGRAFTEEEEHGGFPVAIVSAAAARRLWPARDPIGQVIQLAAAPASRSRLARVRSARVVGVASNAVSGWMGTGLERPVVYYPTSADSTGVIIVARVTSDASIARARIDRDMATFDPSAVSELHALDEYLALQRWPFQLFSWISSAIGAIALALTLVGVYGVLSYLVAQRSREIGIRLALGGSVRRVVGQVLRQSLRYAALGIASGVVLALGVSALVQHMIRVVVGGSFGSMVDTFGLPGYAFGAGLVLITCIVAACAPALRAARVNPAEALRLD